MSDIRLNCTRAIPLFSSHPIPCVGCPMGCPNPTLAQSGMTPGEAENHSPIPLQGCNLDVCVAAFTPSLALKGSRGPLYKLGIGDPPPQFE